jgi:hypothetical protein
MKQEEKFTPSAMIDVILPEAEVRVNIGSGFYQKIQEVVQYLISGKSQEDISGNLAKIEKGEEPETWASHYYTLLVLCKEFETGALNSGFVTKMTVEDYLKTLES